MNRIISFGLILVMLFLLVLSMPFSGSENTYTDFSSDQQIQLIPQQGTSWSVKGTEPGYTLSQRLRMYGHEGYRYSEKLFVSFGKRVQYNSFDIQIFNFKQSLSYKVGIERYREFKLSLASMSFTTQRKCIEGSWTKPSSLK